MAEDETPNNEIYIASIAEPGQGTHIAGIISEGVPEAKIMVIDISSDASIEDIAKAIELAKQYEPPE